MARAACLRSNASHTCKHAWRVWGSLSYGQALEAPNLGCVACEVPVQCRAGPLPACCLCGAVLAPKCAAADALVTLRVHKKRGYRPRLCLPNPPPSSNTRTQSGHGDARPPPPFPPPTRAPTVNTVIRPRCPSAGSSSSCWWASSSSASSTRPKWGGSGTNLWGAGGGG